MSHVVRKEAVVAASKVAAHPKQCPVCLSKTVIIEGYWKRTFVRSMVDGRIAQEEISEHFYEGVDRITCLSCNMHFTVQPDGLIALEQNMLSLLMKQAETEGMVVVPEKESSRPN